MFTTYTSIIPKIRVIDVLHNPGEDASWEQINKKYKTKRTQISI